MNQQYSNCEIPRWQVLKTQLNNLPFEKFVSMAEEVKNSVLIDARTPAEFKMIRLSGALNLDYLGAGFLNELEAMDKNKSYFVYCNSERRSVRVGIMMIRSGFKNVYNLDQGITGKFEHFPEVFLTTLR